MLEAQEAVEDNLALVEDSLVVDAPMAAYLDVEDTRVATLVVDDEDIRAVGA